MILVDANVLVYASNRDSRHHDAARRWIEDAFNGTEPIGLPWVVILAFLRLVTRRSIMVEPVSPEKAYSIVDGWLGLPIVRAVGPGPEHWAVLRGLLGPLGTAGNLTTDAHIAALALENGARVCTADNDFRRFPGVKVINPLA